MPATEYLETAVLGHLLRASTWAKPTGIWLAVLTALPTDEGGLVEVTAADYARLAAGPSDTLWIVRKADGAVINAAAMVWTDPLSAWGLAKGVAAYDAASAGNAFAWAPFPVARDVVANGPALMAQPGTLVWRLNV